jgi:glucose/mannose-6-phosphate isomerase
LLKLFGKEEVIDDLSQLQKTLDIDSLKSKAEEISKRIHDKVPIVYSSTQNRAIAMNWKIRFNENGKVPSYFNVFPELNHNEMIGYGVEGGTRKLSDQFYLIFLTDDTDHPRIKLRMEVTSDIFKKMGIPIEFVPIVGPNIWGKMFSSLVLADWTGYYFAISYGLEPKEVKLVEDLKAMLKERGGEIN